MRKIYRQLLEITEDQLREHTNEIDELLEQNEHNDRKKRILV